MPPGNRPRRGLLTGELARSLRPALRRPVWKAPRRRLKWGARYFMKKLASLIAVLAVFTLLGLAASLAANDGKSVPSSGRAADFDLLLKDYAMSKDV